MSDRRNFIRKAAAVAITGPAVLYDSPVDALPKVSIIDGDLVTEYENGIRFVAEPPRAMIFDDLELMDDDEVLWIAFTECATKQRTIISLTGASRSAMLAAMKRLGR
jgi:hypothetical protein